MVRKARLEEIPELLAIYDYGRASMRAIGDMDQWTNGYPGKELLEEDIAEGCLYVLEREGRIAGVFYCKVFEDPTYAEIDGAWRYDEPYAVIHRIGGAEGEKGVFAEAMAFALTQSSYLRVDTHEDNSVMRHVVEKNGFKYTGIIICTEGTPRVAYDYKEVKMYFNAAEASADYGGEGVIRKVRAHGENVMLCELTFQAGSEGKPHTHVHEQISFVVSGKFEYTIEGQTWTLEKSDSVLVPTNAVHGCKCLETGVLIDVFVPERKDFLH